MRARRRGKAPAQAFAPFRPEPTSGAAAASSGQRGRADVERIGVMSSPFQVPNIRAAGRVQSPRVEPLDDLLDRLCSLLLFTQLQIGLNAR